MSVLQPNASPWTQSYGYDGISRLTSVASAAGGFAYTYPNAISDRIQYVVQPGDGSKFVLHQYDALARLTDTSLYSPQGPLNQHAYQLNNANQRTRQTLAGGNYVDYTYDNIGQLKTAKGWESGGSTARLQEQFGYAYDAAWNLQRRTNNALVQTFGVNNRNELTNATRSGTLTVAGLASQPGANLDHVEVSVNGGAGANADVYADGTWARAGATLADGNNSYTATAEDTTWPTPRTAQDSVTLNLPAAVTFQYDGNGNLTNDGRRVFEYDYENQLTNVYVASAWKSVFQYDAFGRRRVRKEFGWNVNGSVLA
jgi:hypothetical protein